MTHTQNIIRQLRQTEENEEYPDDLRESAGERADELEEQLDEKPAEEIQLVVDIDTDTGRQWIEAYGEQTVNGWAITETVTDRKASCENCHEKKWCYQLHDTRGIPECRDCLEGRFWVKEVREPEE